MLALALGIRRTAALAPLRASGAAGFLHVRAAAGLLQPLSAGFAGTVLPDKIPSINQTQRQSSMGLVALLAGTTFGVLNDPAECMGKRKKKDSALPDDMYEVDYIKARKLEKMPDALAGGDA